MPVSSGISLIHPTNQTVPEVVHQQATTYQSVCVLGLGYVGLPTALLYAQNGFTVQGVDICHHVIEAIEKGEVPERYPELAPWWETVNENHQFSVSTQVAPADIFIIAVPTPTNHVTHECDMRAVNSAINAIIPVLKAGNLIILESTVPPGTTQTVIQPLIEAAGLQVGEDIHLCFSPERILPGNTLHELVKNDRVLGGTTLQSAFLAKSILSRVIEGDIYITDDLTAEFCKLAENTYRDVNIALANELSLVADRIGVNILEALPIINRHPRVNLHRPGIGVGGHCIAVDPWFFVEAAPDITPLIATARAVNDNMPRVTVNKILARIAGIENPKIVLIGLTYKPDVADTRESPALAVYELLKENADLSVVAYDPLLPEHQSQDLPDLVDQADLIVVLVNHHCLETQLHLNRQTLLTRMRTPQILTF